VTDSHPERNAELVETYLDAAWNDGDFDATFVSRDFRAHVNRWDDHYTFDDLRRFGTEMLAAFSDFELDFDDVIPTESKVTVRYNWTGIQTGEFQGISPSENEVRVNGIAIYVVDDRITESWYVEDLFGLYRQIGEFPR
jgi:predicted ester cyclase